MYDELSKTAEKAYDISTDILAVEYLIKRKNKKQYIKKLTILSCLSIAELEMLYVSFSYNKHINSLGSMIINGDYDSQKDELFAYLK